LILQRQSFSIIHPTHRWLLTSPPIPLTGCRQLRYAFAAKSRIDKLRKETGYGLMFCRTLGVHRVFVLCHYRVYVVRSLGYCVEPKLGF
jgi:hypothetical protein